MEGGARAQQPAPDECPWPQADEAAAAAPCGLRHRAGRAWDWANEALAEDWQFNVEFDRCVRASVGIGAVRAGAPGRGWARAAAQSGPLRLCEHRPSPSRPARRYFWRTTVVLYSAFTIKAAPQLSRSENWENYIICAVIAGMAAVST